MDFKSTLMDDILIDSKNYTVICFNNLYLDGGAS